MSEEDYLPSTRYYLLSPCIPSKATTTTTTTTEKKRTTQTKEIDKRDRRNLLVAAAPCNVLRIQHKLTSQLADVCHISQTT